MEQKEVDKKQRQMEWRKVNEWGQLFNYMNRRKDKDTFAQRIVEEC